MREKIGCRSMKALKVLFSGLLLSISMHSLAGGSIDLSLANDSARLAYDATKVGSGLHISASIMHHEDDGDLLALGMHVVDVREPNSPLYIGVGGRLFGFKNGDVDGGALGVGGFFRYQISQVPGLSTAGYAYYAPSVVSFDNTENLADTDLRIQYGLLPTARIYMGYRYSRYKLEGIKKEFMLEEGIHFGLKVDF
tara:strand:+ start:1089 stop:1676 length:588 start_codon:yes stop_codon:yes gene_type:complete